MYKTVLLADDASFMRMVQRAALEKNGFEVCAEAEDGFDVLEKYEDFEPDVLIVGLLLKKLDSIEVLRKLKRSYPEAKIIVCSSSAREKNVAEAMKYGACGFVAKPFDADALISVVNAAVENKKISSLLSEAAVEEWCAAQQNFKPDENLPQEQINRIVSSYYQLFGDDGAHGDKIRVMLADDASFMRMMQKDILEKAGYKICGEAADGLQTTEKYAALRPDLLILDIAMPNTRGFEALRQIKAARPDAKIIICSAAAQENLVADALINGACDFVVKPFHEQSLIDAVKAAADSAALPPPEGKAAGEWRDAQKKYKPGEKLSQDKANRIVRSYRDLAGGE